MKKFNIPTPKVNRDFFTATLPVLTEIAAGDHRYVYNWQKNNGKWNASTYIRGIHIRFLPEGAGDKDITSRVFKGKCALATYGVEEKIVISGTGTTQDPYVYGKRVTPLSDWIAQQSATTNP